MENKLELIKSIQNYLKLEKIWYDACIKKKTLKNTIYIVLKWIYMSIGVVRNST